MIKILLLNELNIEEYEYFFKHTINSTPFHSLEFLNSIAKSRNDLTLRFNILSNNEKTIAIMPYFSHKKIPFTMSSLPYGCYGGYMFFDTQEFNQLLRKDKPFKLFSNIVDYYDTLSYPTNLNYELFSTWVMDTKVSYEDIFNKLHSKTRNQIRRAYKENIQVSDIKEINELNSVFKIYEQLIKKHNIHKPYSKHLFEELYKYSLKSNYINFKVAKIDNRVISYSIFLLNSKSIFYWLNATDNKFLKYNGTNIILDTVLKYATQNGFLEINMGAIPIENNGLLHFKSRWNANEKKYKIHYSKLYFLIKKFR